MYNRQLDAFIKAADLGSFSKAAKELYISTSSLIQQINLLEKHLNICLFTRTARGVSLTKAGISLYEDAKNIIYLSNNAVDRAKSLERSGEHYVKIGTSLFTKCRFITDIWNRTSEKHPEIKLELVAQKAISVMTDTPMEDMGILYDLQEGIYLPGLFQGKCNFFELFSAKICLAVPNGNRLFYKTSLNIQDLQGETIMLTKRGHSTAFDSLRDLLQKNVSDLELIDTDYYDMNIFATCELNNYLMLSLDIWSDIYPSMRTVQLEVDYTVPYGLLYSQNPSEEVLELIYSAQSLLEEGYFKR